MSLLCCRFLVVGRVQGVFFRASTARMARRLGLTGFAHNLADGRVEVLACGKPDAVAKLADWLWQGPPACSVIDVSREEVSREDMPVGRLTEWPPSSFTTG